MFSNDAQQQQYLLELQQQRLQQQQQQAGVNSPTREFTVVALGKSGEGTARHLRAPAATLLGRTLLEGVANFGHIIHR